MLPSRQPLTVRDKGDILAPRFLSRLAMYACGGRSKACLENHLSLCPFAPKKMVSRGRFGRLVPHQPASSPHPAESAASLHDSTLPYGLHHNHRLATSSQSRLITSRESTGTRPAAPQGASIAGIVAYSGNYMDQSMQAPLSPEPLPPRGSCSGGGGRDINDLMICS